MVILIAAATGLRKDVVLAAVASSAGLAGLTLVFLGILITTYQSYPGSAGGEVLGRFRHAAGWTIAAFALGLISVLVSFIWLLLDGPDVLYGPAVGLFVAQLAAVAGLALWVTRLLLR
jgi:hypothetical protein